ncbi:MAG: hypothetical protein ACLT49_11735 [Sutterella wadsworthensis]
MSKKPRPKKKYRPHAVAVPHYLNSLTSDVNRSHDARDEDRVFLLQVANRTVERVDLALYGRILQIAWVLASKMERAKELRQCLYNGLAAIGSYVAEEPKIPFDDEMFEELSQATEVARDILENSGEIERAQAAAAVMSGRIKFESDVDKINDREMVLR